MTTMTTLAPAKINLALVVGPRRPDGKHELATVLQRVGLADSLSLEPAAGLSVSGFADDTLVAQALAALAAEARVEPGWHVRIEKRIPVAAGLGGGSSDAAAVLRLANETLSEPLSQQALSVLARRIGADVPFFLAPGPQLGTGEGADLEPLDLALDCHVLLLVPEQLSKASTASVYEAFDRRSGEEGFARRRAELLDALAAVRSQRDLASLPKNDLASSPLAAELEALGAFRADVSGAGPTVYGLFEERRAAEDAEAALSALGKTWICAPTWYG